MGYNLQERGAGNGEHDTNLALCLDLDFKGVAIRVESDYAIPEGNFQALTPYATGMEIIELPEAESPSGTVIYTPADEVSVGYDDERHELHVRGPAHQFGGGSSLTFAAQYMAECLRAVKTGMLLVHAAAVKAPDQNVSYVILGDKGAGKTTLAIRLCHQYGFRLIGNDQVFLGPDANGELMTDGGNPWFNVRQTAVRSDTYLSQLVPAQEHTEQPAWNSKVQIDPGTIGIKTDQSPTPVGPIIQIRIDHTQQGLQVARWEGIQRNLLLHERFGRHISGQATPFQDDHGNYLGSLPLIEPALAFRARDELVRLVSLAGIIEVFAPDASTAAAYISGDMQ